MFLVEMQRRDERTRGPASVWRTLTGAHFTDAEVELRGDAALAASQLAGVAVRAGLNYDDETEDMERVASVSLTQSADDSLLYLASPA